MDGKATVGGVWRGRGTRLPVLDVVRAYCFSKLCFSDEILVRDRRKKARLGSFPFFNDFLTRGVWIWTFLMVRTS